MNNFEYHYGPTIIRGAALYSLTHGEYVAKSLVSLPGMIESVTNNLLLLDGKEVGGELDFDRYEIQSGIWGTMNWLENDGLTETFHIRNDKREVILGYRATEAGYAKRNGLQKMEADGESRFREILTELGK